MPSKCCCHIPHIASLSACQGQRFQHEPLCGRCGSHHEHYCQCPAANRKCYKCRTYGHYAEFCKNQNHKKVQVRKPTVNVMSAEHDNDFENQFKDKVKNLENSVSNLQQENLDLKSRNVSLENENQTLVKDCDEIRASLCTSRNEMSKLKTESITRKSQIDKLQIINSDLKGKLSKQKNQLDNFDKLRKEHNKLQQEHMSITCENKKLIQNLSESRQEFENEKATLDRQIQQLYKHSVDLSDRVHDLFVISICKTEEFETLSQLENQPRLNNYCSRCGTHTHSNRSKCPANGEKCHNCNGKNHFNVTRQRDRKSVYNIVKTDEDTERLLKTLEVSTGLRSIVSRSIEDG